MAQTHARHEVFFTNIHWDAEFLSYVCDILHSALARSMSFQAKDFIIYLASVRFYHADVSEFLKQSDDGKVSLFLYRAVKGSRHRRRLFLPWTKNHCKDGRWKLFDWHSSLKVLLVTRQKRSIGLRLQGVNMILILLIRWDSFPLNTSLFM